MPHSDPVLEMQAIMAQQQIRDVLGRYCRSIDRMDCELLLSTYHPNARDDHGIFSGSISEFAEWVMKTALPRYNWTMHNLGTINIEVAGAIAWSESYAVAYHGEPTKDGGERIKLLGVRYIDRFESRDNGPWLIADRLVLFDWSSYMASEPLLSGFSGNRGRRDRTDDVYWRGRRGACQGRE